MLGPKPLSRVNHGSPLGIGGGGGGVVLGLGFRV